MKMWQRVSVGPPASRGGSGICVKRPDNGKHDGNGREPEECSNHTIITVTDSLQRQITLVRTSIPKSLQ